MQTIRWLAAIAALVMCVSGCWSHTRITAPEHDPCGDFYSLSVGVPMLYTPAGQYATYRAGCAQYETVRTLAAARNASVQAAYSAAATVRGGARDEVARTGVALLALDIACRDGDGASCAKLNAATQRTGGAR